MLVKTYGSAVQGVNALRITIEVNVSSGSKYFMVGLPDNAVKESLQRVESAIIASGFRMPRTKIVVNLAPADIKKEGSAYDLPIAIGILAASEQIPSTMVEDFVIMGELSLDGTIKPIKGALPIAIEARKDKFKGFVLPSENAYEAAIVNELEVYSAKSLLDVACFFSGDDIILPRVEIDTRGHFFEHAADYPFDFSEVSGQENIKRALEIAAAGGHNAILIGPPGAGKTMLAKRLTTILPPMTLHEALETTKIHSVAGKMKEKESLMAVRPFRSPHHTISDVALVGGGGNPQPGEISLAHHGVLFLDELPEFKRTVLEVMRQPLEERRVTISRAKVSIDYPANFMLIAAMNPCPCGYFNHPEKDCVCAPGVVQKYLSKISGPLLDRIDLHVEVTPVSFNQLSQHKDGELSKNIRERVMNARETQINRFKEHKHIFTNAMMGTSEVRAVCQINKVGENLLKKAMERLGLSARAYDRILKVSRTIADLSNSENIKAEHLAEAIQYRSLDRETWGLA
jgi:magnesium chelatase family protein